MRRQTKQKRGVFVVNAATSAVAIVVLAAVALVANPPAPPSIAEFAPQAQQQIDEAPDEQSAESGLSGAGAGERETIVIEEEAQAAAAVAGAQETIVIEGVPSAVNCVTWPDGSVTQNFDPQSPPCIATWDIDAGNGGATWQGVTDTEIHLVWPGYDPEAESQDFDRALVDYFNKSFQFYGRRLVLSGVPWSRSPEEQVASAEQAIEAKAFAALDFDYASNQNASYLRRLAKGNIIGIVGPGTELTDAEVEELGPYVWSSQLSQGERMTLAGQYICGALDGRPAQYANDTILQNSTRTWAIVQGDSGTPLTPVEDLQEHLRSCGIEAPAYTPSGALDNPTERQQVAAQLWQDGITSVIVVDSLEVIHSESSAIGYYPEWVATGTGRQPGFMSAGAGQNVFGLYGINKVLPRSSEFVYQAARSVGFDTSGQCCLHTDRNDYQRLLALASGIQMAGPNLTPETFKAGLQATWFPNPGAGQAPFWQGGASFSNRSHSFLGDTALFWFNPTLPAYFNSRTPGAPCLWGQGVRFTSQTMPTDDEGFFNIASAC
jgi:hypothetical protein